jgi:hypothetical protein
MGSIRLPFQNPGRGYHTQGEEEPETNNDAIAIGLAQRGCDGARGRSASACHVFVDECAKDGRRCGCGNKAIPWPSLGLDSDMLNIIQSMSYYTLELSNKMICNARRSETI